MSVRALRGIVIKERQVTVRGQKVHLRGSVPSVGTRWQAEFSLPPARHASRHLTRADLEQGLVLLSTLPNIQNHACAMQVVHIEEHARLEYPDARVVHVSADDAEFWSEVDEFHGDLRAPAYTLDGAGPESRRSFCESLGIAVRESRRVAHGLFALQDGIFMAVEVPDDQMATPDVHDFLGKLGRARRAASSLVCGLAVGP